jgi:hypothetical protein
MGSLGDIGLVYEGMVKTSLPGEGRCRIAVEFSLLCGEAWRMKAGDHDPRAAPPPAKGWWERSWLLAALILGSAVPLVWPDIPPLVDLPGHMGRYRVQLDLDVSPALQHFYRFEWALIGNLGVDLLVAALAPLIGLEAAVKLIVMTIPPLTAAGFILVAREVHGRVPPTALFALPLAYNFPFLFGFVNFALAMALALLAFALWLRLERGGSWRLRAALFVPIGIALWLCHAFGWATLGLLAFSAGFVRQLDQGRAAVPAAYRAALHCLPLAPPVLLMLLWRSGAVAGGTGDWFNWPVKLQWFAMMLRDRWMLLDVASVILLCLLVFAALRQPGRLFSRHLAASALSLAAVYLLLPRILLGSAYADMRLAPYMLALALLAIRDVAASRRTAGIVAAAGLAFIGVRTAGTTASMALYDRAYDRELEALDHVPEGARLVAFVGRECREEWAKHRLEHLPALATVRRHAFSNDQWTMAGAQLLRVDYPPGGDFVADPSQIVVPQGCAAPEWRTIERSLAEFPRGAFDYVWLIRPPPYDPALARGLRPVWRSGSSTLYRVEAR